MKKAVRIFAVFMLITFLVGCTSEMKTYKKAIVDASIEESLNEIEESIQTVYKSFDTLLNSVDLSIVDMTALEDLSVSKDLLDQYTTRIDVTLNKVETIDTSNSDVKALNDKLLGALNKYKEISGVLNEVVSLITQVMTIMETVKEGNEQLESLGQQSQEYAKAIDEFMTSNLDIQQDISVAYSEVLSSGNFDMDIKSTLIANIQILIAGLSKLPAVSDADQAYNKILISMYGSMIEMVDLFTENTQSISIIGEFEETTEDSVKKSIEEAAASVKDWKAALNK